MSHLLFTDGGARGNPGPAGAGAVLTDSSGKIISKAKKYLGEITNNQAEYQALILGLQLASKSKIPDLQVFMDSKLVVEQVSNRWKIKHPNLKPLHIQTQILISTFPKISFKHITRDKNKIADQLANQAMDSKN